MIRMIFWCFILANVKFSESLNYDGYSYSIYPRLDFACENSTFSFEFQVDSINNLNNNKTRLLVYQDQIGKTKYFSLRLNQHNKLVFSDHRNTDKQLALNIVPNFWYKFIYKRKTNDLNKAEIIIKQNSDLELHRIDVSCDLTEFGLKFDNYTQLFVAGLPDSYPEKLLTYQQVKNVAKFSGKIRNLIYSNVGNMPSTTTSVQQTFSLLPSTCSCDQLPRRQYSLFSTYIKRVNEDICESDQFTYNLCSKQCTCLTTNDINSNHKCDCSTQNQNNCNYNYQLKSFQINFNDDKFNSKSFDYALKQTGSLMNVKNIDTYLDVNNAGLQFKTLNSFVGIKAVNDISEDDACFWDIDNCKTGFTQYIDITIDRLELSKLNTKQIVFQNGLSGNGKPVLTCYIYSNRIYFSLYKQKENEEWLVSGSLIDKRNTNLLKNLQITLNWIINKSLSLNLNGILIDSTNEALTKPINKDLLLSNNNNYNYQFGNYNSGTDQKMHQFTIKFIRRDYQVIDKIINHKNEEQQKHLSLNAYNINNNNNNRINNTINETRNINNNNDLNEIYLSDNPKVVSINSTSQLMDKSYYDEYQLVENDGNYEDIDDDIEWSITNGNLSKLETHKNSNQSANVVSLWNNNNNNNNNNKYDNIPPILKSLWLHESSASSKSSNIQTHYPKILVTKPWPLCVQYLSDKKAMNEKQSPLNGLKFTKDTPAIIANNPDMPEFDICKLENSVNGFYLSVYIKVHGTSLNEYRIMSSPNVILTWQPYVNEKGRHATNPIELDGYIDILIRFGQSYYYKSASLYFKSNQTYFIEINFDSSNATFEVYLDHKLQTSINIHSFYDPEMFDFSQSLFEIGPVFEYQTVILSDFLIANAARRYLKTKKVVDVNLAISSKPPKQINEPIENELQNGSYEGRKDEVFQFNSFSSSVSYSNGVKFVSDIDLLNEKRVLYLDGNQKYAVLTFDNFLQDPKTLQEGFTLVISMKVNRFDVDNMYFIYGNGLEMYALSGDMLIKYQTDDKEWNTQITGLQSNTWYLYNITWDLDGGLRVFVNNELAALDAQPSVIEVVTYLKPDLYIGQPPNEGTGHYGDLYLDFIMRIQTSRTYNESIYSEGDEIEHSQDSRVLVSAPLPSEIIKIDNTQRVMYRIDSPLTSVTSETIELAFRTTQSNGVVFYIRNNPIITYFELVDGLPQIIIDTHYNSIRLTPRSPSLNDNQWHEIKLHRDGSIVTALIDNLHYDEKALGHTNAILTGGYVYLGIVDPNNINLSTKKPFIGEMIRGKVTVNNVQQKVSQQPYWPAAPQMTTNQTVNIDTSQLTADGKVINIVINVYGPPGTIGNIGAQVKPGGTTTHTDTETHYIYLDNLPDTRYISVMSGDRELDFRTGSTILEGFVIKFQTRQPHGQLVTLIGEQNNYLGLEIFEGLLYSTSSYMNKPQRYQISRQRVDDGKIYQVHIRQEPERILCWVDADESYKQSIVYNKQPVYINTVRVAGEDGSIYGYRSRYSFVGCIGSVLLNNRDVIDYQVVQSERRQSCQEVIKPYVPPVAPPPVIPPPTTTPPPPPQPSPEVSFGYISFTHPGDVLTFNFMSDYERINCEDVSFIFRTVQSSGVIFAAHNMDNYNPSLIGAYLQNGYVHVIYVNMSTTFDLSFNHTTVNDGNLYRLNIRRMSNGQILLQLQSYTSVTSLDFYTRSGYLILNRFIIGGADEWSRIKYFGTRPDFVGCIMDLFYINGNNIIKPVEIPKHRYSCTVESTEIHIPQPTPPPPTRPPVRCLEQGYTLSFENVHDAVSFDHETKLCARIVVPFRTTSSRGILYSHISDDRRFYIAVYLKRGLVNVAVKDGREEKEVEFENYRVNDGNLHTVEIQCDSRNNFIIAYIDDYRQLAKRIEVFSPIYLNSYTLGYYQDFPSKLAQYENFKGCLEQVTFNDECLIHDIMADRDRLYCYVRPEPQTPAPPAPTPEPPKAECINACQGNQCLLEFLGRGYVLYQIKDRNYDRESIRFYFRTTSSGDQDLVTISHPDRNIRIYLRDGQLLTTLGNSYNYPINGVYNDGKWHRAIFERNNQELIITIDNNRQAVNFGVDFDLYGDGRLYFGASNTQNSYNFVGELREIYVKYGSAEYDIIASAKDGRIPGALCQGSIVVKTYVEEQKEGLNCGAEPSDPHDECNTNGACFTALWRNNTGAIEKFMRCFTKDQLQPVDNPILCRSQDEVRYVIQCCYTDYCNRQINIKLKDLKDNDGRSIWRLRGNTPGSVQFLPIYQQNIQQSQLNFQFNTTRPDGNLFLTKDENTVLRLDLKAGRLQLSALDLNNRRATKTVECRTTQTTQLNDNKWHKVELTKRNRVVTLSCDDGPAQTLQYDVDLPFVNTRYGIRLGSDGTDSRAKGFIGDFSMITYKQDDVLYVFDDLQYSEDARYSYDGYIEFRPKYTSEVYAGESPMKFRSDTSSARFNNWDERRFSRLYFEFKVDTQNGNGVLFSTSTNGNYFAIVLVNGYLEAIQSPYLFVQSDKTIPENRLQRIFPFPNVRVNDGQWHKFSLNLLSNAIGQIVLDNDQNSKFRIHRTDFWSEESDLVFGKNSDIAIQLNGGVTDKSFKGCIKDLSIDSPINWSIKGVLYNIEAGCHNDRFGQNYLSFLNTPSNEIESASRATLNGNGCIRYNSPRTSDNENVEFFFKTNDDLSVLFHSYSSDFILHTQGPTLVIRSKSNNGKTLIIERGIAFNDGNWHKVKIEKRDTQVDFKIDERYFQTIRLPRRTALSPFYLGCGRSKSDSDLKDLNGQINDAVYYTSEQDRIDIIGKLSEQDGNTLTDNSVTWLPRTPKQSFGPQSEPVTLKDSNSFVVLDRVDFDRNPNTKINFAFKTNENDGLLGVLSSNNNNYLAVELSNGVPYLTYNVGNQLKRVECTSDKLNDNKWHNIQIRRDRLGDGGNNASPTSTVTFSCDNRNTRFEVPDESIQGQYIIGNPSKVRPNLPWELWQSRNPQFLGCIKDFSVSDRSYDLYQTTSSQSRETIAKGCQDQSVHCARSSRCQNGGTCGEGFARTYCNCDTTSFTGQYCDLPSNTLSFNGSYGIEYVLHDSEFSSSEDISLRFKTRLRDGLLFALKKSPDEPSLVLSLEDGRIKSLYDCGKHHKVGYIGDPDLFNNNKWNSVRLKRMGSRLQLEVTDADSNRNYIVDDLGKGCTDVEYRYIEIGDIQSQRLLPEYASFVGWIQNLRFNGNDYFSYYMNNQPPNNQIFQTINGYADIGENTLLLHHQATFSETCPISLDDAYSNDNFNFHLYFKTADPDGVIFFRRGRNFYPFMLLELMDGNIRFLFDLGGGRVVYKLDTPYKLNDKNWHEVTIKRKDRQKFYIKVDDSKDDVDIPPKSGSLTEFESFVIGGIPIENHHYFKDFAGTKGYTGCLASLEINGEAPDLLHEAPHTCTSVKYGCTELECTPNPCFNEGTCQVVANSIRCDCDMTSFEGQYCRDSSKFFYFGGNSRLCGSVKYTITPSIDQQSDKLAFGFYTSQPDGSLARIQSENNEQYIEVKLVDGHPTVFVKLDQAVDTKRYSVPQKFNDNIYHLFQLTRELNNINFKVDNFEYDQIVARGNGIFRKQSTIFVGSIFDNKNTLTECYSGYISGMVWNGYKVLSGTQSGDILITVRPMDNARTNITIAILPDGTCPLGYLRADSICYFDNCPKYSEFFAKHTCRCTSGFYQYLNECVEGPKLDVLKHDGTKLILAPAAGVAETPIGLILGIISAILLGLLGAGIAARKCADGACIPAGKKYTKVPVHITPSQAVAKVVNTTLPNNPPDTLARREVPIERHDLIQSSNLQQQEEFYQDSRGADVLDFGYGNQQYMQQAPFVTQSVNETMEMFEQSTGGAQGGTTYITTGGTLGSMGATASAHHTSTRDLAMDSMFYSQNATDYELSNVTCVTMTPNGKYAIIGQSIGPPQIWDTTSGQLVRGMGGAYNNCSNLTLTCNGTLLVGLTNDGTLENHASNLQLWEVQSGRPIQMTHQIKCCVFCSSADSNSIFMAGNQRFGRGISVGILDLVSNELAKEIKSDPNISFGDYPESILVTPDEKHAIVGCRSAGGTNFVVFDLTKTTEIAQTRSITLDADPKCMLVLNNNEVLTGTKGGHIIQWNIHSCKPTCTFIDQSENRAHTSYVNQLVFSADKEHIASASSDGTAKVWNTNSKQLVAVMNGHHGEITCIATSHYPNNDLLVTGSSDHTIGLWRLYTGHQISSFSVGMNVVEVNMAKHNKTIVAIGEKDGEQQLVLLRVINVQK